MSKAQIDESKAQQSSGSSTQNSLSIEEQGIDTISESERKERRQAYSGRGLQRIFPYLQCRTERGH